MNGTDDPAALTADDIDSMIVASLKPVPIMLETINAPLTAQTWYWLLWGLPLAALAGGFVWQRRHDHLEQNADSVRSSRARKQAPKPLPWYESGEPKVRDSGPMNLWQQETF